MALSKSISSIQLKDVRDEAGLARGGIYRYYQNLDEILGALILKINSENSYIDDVGKILGELCKRKGIEIIEAEACPDHIHM